MLHSLLLQARFLLVAAVLVLSSLGSGSLSTARGQSFSITDQKAYGPVLDPYNRYISINNLSGKTQLLSVTVINPDSSLQFQMLNIKSEVVPLGKSIVLFKDSTGFDHGTFIFAHPFLTGRKFTTFVIFSDASNKTSDTLSFTVNDSIPPSKKHVMQITPQSPVIILMGSEASKSFDLKVKNLTTADYNVSIDQNGSNKFSLPSSLSLSGKSGANTTDLTITYTRNGGNAQDSTILDFIPSFPGGETESVVVFVIDTIKNPPYVDIFTRAFYNVPVNSINCDNITITNNNDIPVTITSLAITGTDASQFALSQAPTFPITIDKHSTLKLPYCFTAPGSRHTNSLAELEVTYHAEGTGDATLKGYLYGITQSCVIMSPDSLQYGDLIAGGNADGQVTITNTLDNAITLTGDGWDFQSNGPEFTLTNMTFPVTLAAKESKTLKFHWAPAANTRDYSVGHYFVKYTGAGDSECTIVDLDFVGHIVDPSDTTTRTYKLFPNIASAMPIESDKQTTTKDFIFYNNTQNAVKVISVSVKDGTHFAIVSPLSTDLPLTLKPNDQMKVTISFDANTNGFYDDELDIVTENGLQSQAFGLQGVRKNGLQAGVAAQTNTTPEITLSPNPSVAGTSITVSGVTPRSIEIYDMLGNIVASQKNANIWIWNGRNMNDENISSGTYFIRTSGVTENGNSFVKTMKFIRH